MRWLPRGLVGASGAALLVPVGLLVAVAVAATFGGGGVGPLGQLVGGPAVPEATALANGGRTTPRTTDVPQLPVRPPARRPSARRSAAVATPARQGRSRRADRRTTRRRATTRPRRGTGSVPKRRPAAPAPTTTTTTPAPTATTPAPETNPLRRIGKAVQDTVRPIPLVGPTAADAVGTVVDLIAPGTARSGTGTGTASLVP